MTPSLPGGSSDIRLGGREKRLVSQIDGENEGAGVTKQMRAGTGDLTIHLSLILGMIPSLCLSCTIPLSPLCLSPRVFV